MFARDVIPMYDLRQFKPTLYFVLLLGLTAFTIAAASPALWLLTTAAVLLNAHLVRRGRFRPLPRWLANGATVLSLVYIIAQIVTRGSSDLLLIGQFLVLLQLVKLYEQRANRDYAQLIVLSLLTMVAAAISTTSLVVGILFFIWLFSSLYCGLLFHLKCETDRARAALAISEENISPVTLRQDQRHVGSSMRRLTALVSVFALFFGTLVFLVFPRGSGGGVLGQLNPRPNAALTGFSDRVSFEQINRIKQNDELVGHVSVRRDGAVVSEQPLYLRGLTLDVYGGDRRAGGGARPVWTRSIRGRVPEIQIGPDQPLETGLTPQGPLSSMKVTLQPSGTRFLFSIPGPVTVQPGRRITVGYWPHDESIQVDTDLGLTQLEYEVTATNVVSPPSLVSLLAQESLMGPFESDPKVLEQVRGYILEQDVTQGLAQKRSRLRLLDPNDRHIADRIEAHLQTDFTYTLDLTDARKQMESMDPVVAFLTEVKRGHCEYSASAMTLMCQSLGIPARMVIGFKSDEFNAYGGFYIVKQSHAHAWVEVLTAEGWKTYDPTALRGYSGRKQSGWLDSLRQMFEFLEFQWAVNVVAYENRDRQALLERAEEGLSDAAGRAAEWLNWISRFPEWLKEKMSQPQFWTSASTLLGALLVLVVLALFVVVGVFVVQQRRLRRRAARIGLDALPMETQLKLARQLEFYDMLTRFLARHGIHRPQHLTPMEFARSLAFLPAELYRTIQRLTGLFYQVRFGSRSMHSGKQRRLHRVVSRLGESLEGLMPAARN